MIRHVPKRLDALAPWLAGSYAIHLADERLTGAGVADWATRVAGMPFTNGEWLIVNAISLSVVVLLAWAIHSRRLGPAFALLVAGHVFMHATQHFLGAVRFGESSPGVATGLLLCLPVSAYAFVLGFRILGPGRAIFAFVCGAATFQPIWHAAILNFSSALGFGA